MEAREKLSKAVLAGLGAVVLTKDAVSKAVSRLVEEGKIGGEDAKKFAEELLDKAEEEGKSAASRLSELLSKLPESMNLVTKEDLRKLQDRMDRLEKMLRESLESRGE